MSFGGILFHAIFLNNLSLILINLRQTPVKNPYFLLAFFLLEQQDITLVNWKQEIPFSPIKSKLF